MLNRKIKGQIYLGLLFFCNLIMVLITGLLFCMTQTVLTPVIHSNLYLSQNFQSVYKKVKMLM